MESSEDEKQEVEPFEATVFPSSRSMRNPVSRVFHGCLIFPLLLVMALAISSLSYFAVTNSKVEDTVTGSGDTCILFARYSGNKFHFGSNHGCIFSIFGEVAVAVAAALLVIWMIIKTSAGFHLTTWVLLCEIPVFLLCAIFAFCVSITISIGLAYSCGEYKKVDGATGGCGNFTVPYPPPPAVNKVHFHTGIYKSMVTSWLAMILLGGLFILHVLLFIMFCVKKRRNKSGHHLLPVSDGESSSDGEETDEPMVPIAELEKH